MNRDISLSVALVTRNRPASLRRCLASLRAQDTQPHEVVVSDDSDAVFAGEVRDVASEFAARHIGGPQRGLYANRNAAALACTGTHVRTMDDDHTLPPGHLSRCMDAILSEPRCVWTTGERSFLNGELFSEMPRASQLHPAGVGGPVSDPDDNWAIADGSTIYPREVFARGLRLIETWRGYSASYLEFGAYLHAHGIHGRCIPGAMVEHHPECYEASRSNPASTLFASLVFNLHFRRSLPRALRYVLPQFIHSPRLLATLPGVLRAVRERWTFSTT